MTNIKNRYEMPLCRALISNEENVASTENPHKIKFRKQSSQNR